MTLIRRLIARIRRRIELAQQRKRIRSLSPF